MSEVWKFLTKPIFTFPPFTKTLCQALLIFVLTLYLGYWGTLRIRYRYELSHQFESLGSNALPVRSSVRVLSQLEVSGLLTPATEADLLKQIELTEGIRSKVPSSLADIVSLQQAMNYLMLARVEEGTDHSSAASHLQMARGLLQSLGWQDVSDGDLNTLADKELKWKRKPSRD